MTAKFDANMVSAKFDTNVASQDTDVSNTVIDQVPNINNADIDQDVILVINKLQELYSLYQCPCCGSELLEKRICCKGCNQDFATLLVESNICFQCCTNSTTYDYYISDVYHVNDSYVVCSAKCMFDFMDGVRQGSDVLDKYKSKFT